MRKTVTLAAAALTALCMMTGASAITDDFTDLTAEDIMAGEVSPDETVSYETTDELKTVTIRITGGADGSRYAAYRLLDLVDGNMSRGICIRSFSGLSEMTRISRSVCSTPTARENSPT